MEMGTAHHFGWVPSGTHPPFYYNPCIKCKARWVPRPLANLDPRGRLLDPPGRLLETQDRFLKPRGRQRYFAQIRHWVIPGQKNYPGTYLALEFVQGLTVTS